MKKLIVFDLDGTLAQSKAPLDVEMAALLNTLLGIVNVAVISGGDWPQFEKQVLDSRIGVACLDLPQYLPASTAPKADAPKAVRPAMMQEAEAKP